MWVPNISQGSVATLEYKSTVVSMSTNFETATSFGEGPDKGQCQFLCHHMYFAAISMVQSVSTGIYYSCLILVCSRDLNISELSDYHYV